MLDRVQKVLDTVRPKLQIDGGDVELVSVEDNIVKVRLTGACVGCPFSEMTLKAGIEQVIMEEIPEIVEVQSV